MSPAPTAHAVLVFVSEAARQQLAKLSPPRRAPRLHSDTAVLVGSARPACLSVPVCTGEENVFPLGNLELGPKAVLCPLETLGVEQGIPTEVLPAVMGVMAVLLLPPGSTPKWA